MNQYVEFTNTSLRRPVLCLLSLALFAMGLCSRDAQAGVQLELALFFCGSQENPAVDSAAFGGGTGVIDTDANTLTYRVSFGDLSAAETAAHIHGPADPGSNAGVVFALPAGNPKVGVWNYPQAMEADLLAGRMYMNIHTSAHPGGEIRAQISDAFAFLDGPQETPPVPTDGYGVGVFDMNTDLNQLKYYIVTDDLSAAETAAHIHGFALHGTAAGVLHTLPAGSPKIGVWNYSEDQEEAILTGRTYVNVHTTAFPGGEIRGQIVPMVIPVDGTQEVPPSGSTAAAMGLLSFDPNAHALSYYIWVAGLSSAETAAHIHGFAAPGSNAGVQHTLPAGSRKLGVWNFGAANQAQVFNGLTYINVHTTNFPAGEIRGQVHGFYHLVPADVSEALTPATSRLLPSVPNPSNGSTEIRLRLEAPGLVQLDVFDSQGRLVRNLLTSDLSGGEHSVTWDGIENNGRRAANGVYRYLLRTAQGTEGGALTLIR